MSFSVVSVHDGVSELLDETYDEDTNTLSFQNDRFSTYSVIYKSGDGL